ncbi:hypothetical protein M422DRAFT_251274 [Sphaerobolus stellatus SS14]|uniref:Unplaced genomic scaffold SPHSTscaffold_38, whole genome shotgun sequence n=1 Tax=Sphaerobolus stellatus (strain SS14) TaxID=990650 RepID=A0A0C9W270_SPHS4|nr:hypothetical protein M422DRAFT_251274 [Sphaerobolus stellatus SS14]
MSSRATHEDNILAIPTTTTVPSPQEPSLYDPFRGTDVPIIIDNGATTLRWGFATATSPVSQPNIITKYKERKTNRPLLLFGDAVEFEGGAKAQARTPWEGDVLLNVDALENALDYVFINLGIDTQSVEHPIFMTERLASPSHSRALTSELMFEQYTVPSLTYCVDSLMSLYQNNQPAPGQAYMTDGLVVSLNTASTSVIPVLHGKGIMSQAKRIPWSTTQSYDYLQKLIQLKYPNFPSRITSSHVSWIFQNTCEFAPDYTALLRTMKDPAQMRAHERIIQFPFATPVESEKTEEELTRISDRRKEQGRRLQEMAAKQRLEKLQQKEIDLAYLVSLKESRGELRKAEWLARLEAEGFDDEASLEETIKKLDSSVKKGKKKEGEGEDVPMEEPSYPLLEVPDDQLDEDALKEKRRQKLLKAGWEARQKIRREKERERAEKEDQARRELEERERDFDGWTSRLKGEHEAMMDKLKERKRRRAALSDRKSATAQARMKTIASLASETPTTKKRRKGNGEDNFGANDEDWAVYRKINTAASSDEEDDISQLQTIEAKLLEFDPSFTEADTYSSLATQRSALVETYLPRYQDNDIAGQCRIHLNVERWRACEPWFNPSMAGIDTAGLGEVIAGILSGFSEAEKARLVKNVFITGTPAQIPGLSDRLFNTLRPILDPDMEVKIVKASDVGLDAWNGMRAFANADKDNMVRYGVSKAEYDEWGGERIKRWWGGNWNWAV